MTPLPIDGIRFEFDDTWTVAKWDDSRWYVDGIKKLNGLLDERAEGTKAVDAFGVRDGVPYLFEVKDFRGFAIENKQRQFAELPLEIGLKARDTVAGLLGWVALGKEDDLPLRWVHAAQGGNEFVHVIAFIAEDASRPGEPLYKRGVRDQVRSSCLTQRLAWLTPRVLVKDPLRDAGTLHRIGVQAKSEAGAGPARLR